MDANKRLDSDLVQLLAANHVVNFLENKRQFTVTLHGPKNTMYEGGVWEIMVEIPENYPFKSPSIRFVDKILHPNVDEKSGSVCLDVLNQTWSPLFNLVNIFEEFLPHLLAYPNTDDPLNRNAAYAVVHSPKEFKSQVRQLIEKKSEKKEDALNDGSAASIHSDLSDYEDDDDDC